MKKLRERTLWFITTTSIFIVVMVCVVLYNQRVIMVRQEQEIAELNQTIGEYRINEEWFEDYIDLLEEVYEGKINEAILEERLKNQPNNEKYIEQILDDLELLMELQQHYYQENITSHSFGDWVQINYPALYERVLNYY